MNGKNSSKLSSLTITNPTIRPEDIKALERIRKITRSGHNAEVKEKNGTLIVYDVSKTITV